MSRKSKNMDTQRGTHTPSTPPNRDINAAQRAAMALALRAKKMTFEAIAAKCGYSSASACRKAILREMDRVVVRNVEHLRNEESLILDKLHQECWEIAMDKGNKGRLFAVDRLIQLSEARRKLFGLDAQKDANVAANQVIVRELPSGYLSPVLPEGPQP